MTLSVSQHRITPNSQLPKAFDDIINSRKASPVYKTKVKESTEPKSISLNQVELLKINIPYEHRKVMLELKEAMPRTSIVAPDGTTLGTGSAVSVNPAGIYLTAFHAAVASNGSLFDLLFGRGSNKLFIDIPNQEPLPAKIITYDDHLDIALVALDRKDVKQDPRAFLSLDAEKKTAGTKTYKIGHYKGSLPGSLSQGEILNPSARKTELFGSDCPECERKTRLIISTNPLGGGDSGCGLLNPQGGVSGISTAVMYPESQQVTSPDYFQGHEFISVSTSIAESILPFLERELSKRDFKKLIDGNELVFKKPLRAHTTLPFSIIILGFPPSPESLE